VIIYQNKGRPVTSLGHQGSEEFSERGPDFFKLCPTVLEYVQHIFPGGGQNISQWVPRPHCALLVTGLHKGFVLPLSHLLVETRQKQQGF